MKTSSYDWSKFTKRIPIASDLSTIYKSWTTRSGLESWFLSKAEFKSSEGIIRKDHEPTQAQKYGC